MVNVSAAHVVPACDQAADMLYVAEAFGDHFTCVSLHAASLDVLMGTFGAPGDGTGTRARGGDSSGLFGVCALGARVWCVDRGNRRVHVWRALQPRACK